MLSPFTMALNALTDYTGRHYELDLDYDVINDSDEAYLHYQKYVANDGLKGLAELRVGVGYGDKGEFDENNVLIVLVNHNTPRHSRWQFRDIESLQRFLKRIAVFGVLK
jgi:hypothetical protein